MVTSSSQDTNSTTNPPQDDINSPHHPLSMLIALSAKNKLKLINGEYDEPTVDSPLRAYWERENDMLISWILNTVSEQIGYPKEECYKLLGYPLGHPLHNKYQPPSQRTQQANRGQRSVNMMTGDNLPPMDTPLHPMNSPDQYSTSTTSDVAESQVHARMDLLQNQLNQVILMMQNQGNQAETSGTAPHVAGILSFSDNITIPIKVTGIHSFNSAAKMYSFIASHMTKPKSHFIWVVDSGATDHVCISLSLMHNITKLHTPIIVFLPNGNTTQVTYTGLVRLTQSLTIDNVFYIPTFTYNLISISRILHNIVHSLTFTQDKFVFQTHDGSKTHGILHGGLYLLPFTSTPKSSSPTLLSSISNSHLWHTRLGHTPLQTIKKIKDIPVFSYSSDSKCTICPLAKHHVLPFPISTSHAKSKFELVHIDVWGPYKHPTLNKCTYFLTIIDDFSGAT
ncbi:cysteine-rich receptor-like protein kinase 8 [Tanacetum coccineum]